MGDVQLQTAAHVMRNMLLAHARAYKAIKEMPGVPSRRFRNGSVRGHDIQDSAVVYAKECRNSSSSIAVANASVKRQSLCGSISCPASSLG